MQNTFPASPSDLDLEGLLEALSEFFLDSGFRDPWSEFSSLDGDHTLDNLRQAIRQALEEAPSKTKRFASNSTSSTTPRWMSSSSNSSSACSRRA